MSGECSFIKYEATTANKYDLNAWQPMTSTEQSQSDDEATN